MQGPGGFPDRFANNDIIPHFNQNGTALTQEERAAIAKRKGICVNCGVKTHTPSVFTKKLTNENVYKGVCIKCNPTSVPSKVLQEYEIRNPRINAPVVAARPSANRQPKRTVTSEGHSRTEQSRDPRHGRPNSMTAPPPAHSDSHSSSNANNSSANMHSHKRTSNDLKSKQKQVLSPHSRGKGSVRTSERGLNQNSLSNLSNSKQPDFNDSFVSSANSFMSSSTGASGRPSNSKLSYDYTGGVGTPSDVDVDALLQTLKDERGDAELLTQTLHRLRNFGYDQDPKEAISEIRDLMDQYVNDPRVMAIACSALWRLSAGQKSRKIEAAENGAIESIVDALRKDQSRDDVEFIQWAVGCLASLADAQEVKKFIATIGGIEVIVDVLNHHLDSPGVFEWAARALHNLAYQREGEGKDISDVITRNLFSIEEAGGIKALVRAMRNHPNESTAQGWAMRLLWTMQDQDDEDVVNRILKKMKDDGFIKASVKVLKTRATDGETDLFRLSADLMCNLLTIDRSDSVFRDASDCLTTIARNMKEDGGEDSVKHAVKLESCCRVIATLMNGTDYSRMLVTEVNGAQAVLEVIEQHPDNSALLNTGIWTFWAMSAAERETDKDDMILIRAAELVYEAVEAHTEKVSDLLLPVCGFFSNMCLVPGMVAAKIPIAAIVQSLFTVEDDSSFLKEAERAVSNFCTAFPDQVDLVVDALDLDRLQDILNSDNDLTPTLAAAVASVASKSALARSRIASPDIIASLAGKLRDPDNPFMMKPYLELMATLVISGNHKSTRLPDDIVQIVLRVLGSGSSSETQWICCALLRNLIGSAASPPDVSGLVDSMVSLVDLPTTQENLKVQACGVLWSLTGKYPKQSADSLGEMSRSMISILIKYKGDQGPFDYDLLAMAAGALASVTACMLHCPVQVSSEDVDEIISVPYTALDFEADRTELYVRILDSIYNLSYVSDAVLIQCGVIVVVIDTMAEFEQCLEVQQFGCAILAVLASTENLQVNLSIVQTDGIDMIVNALALFSEDKVVQSQACKALSHLSIDEESRMLIASLGGLMLLGNTMRANMDELDLLEGALSAVLSLSADADVELLTESNIVAVVVSVMRHHRANSQIQEFGMGVLQNISMRCFESKQNIAEAGGILAVADCIREFMGSPTVLERAFTTLWSLAVLDSNQALIAEADGINLVVNGMMTAITYEGVQKQGCGCLCTLSSDSRNKGLIQNVGGVDSIVYAMWAHYGAEEIQVEACRALSSLAVDAQTNEVMIASDGEVNAIISAMRRFPMSERLQEHACVALRNFLLSADNVDIIKSNEHEVKTLVQQAGSRFPATCQERANQVLASLG